MRWLQPIQRIATDLLFPAICGRCGEEGHFWCLDRQTGLPWPACFRCRRPYHPEEKRDDCRRSLPLLSIGPYADPLLRTTLHDWKYKSYWRMSEDWATLLGQFARSRNLLRSESRLVPIPLHPRRQRERGFNQAAVLARGISRVTHQPVQPILRRRRATKAQAQLDPDKRPANIQDAFEVVELGHHRSVWLVDDVITTGATLQEAHRTLRQGGWEVVGVFTVAYADPTTKNSSKG